MATKRGSAARATVVGKVGDLVLLAVPNTTGVEPEDLPDGVSVCKFTGEWWMRLVGGGTAIVLHDDERRVAEMRLKGRGQNIDIESLEAEEIADPDESGMADDPMASTSAGGQVFAPAVEAMPPEQPAITERPEDRQDGAAFHHQGAVLTAEQAAQRAPDDDGRPELAGPPDFITKHVSRHLADLPVYGGGEHGGGSPAHQDGHQPIGGDVAPPRELTVEADDDIPW